MAKHCRLDQRGIIERWETLITTAHGQGEAILSDIRRLLDDAEVPGVIVERRRIAAGVVQGLCGGKRPFLIIRHTANPHLKAFKMLINVKEYGTNLHISWFLIHQPSGWTKCMNFILAIPIISLIVFPFYLIGRLIQSREAGILDLNAFDEQDLRAYVTFAHHCLIEAIEMATREEEREAPSLRRHSTGFLGIV